MSPDGRLRDYPFVVVRFACRECPRLGRYRLAVLAEALWRGRDRRPVAALKLALAAASVCVVVWRSVMYNLAWRSVMWRPGTAGSRLA